MIKRGENQKRRELRKGERRNEMREKGMRGEKVQRI
jgi:hypothetical protein